MCCALVLVGKLFCPLCLFFHVLVVASFGHGKCASALPLPPPSTPPNAQFREHVLESQFHFFLSPLMASKGSQFSFYAKIAEWDSYPLHS